MIKELDRCNICPHNCNISRNAGKIGRCRATDKIKIALYSTHNFEEPCISGEKGSGTVFFSNCNLNCVFCQNYPISQLGNGNFIKTEELANKMIILQNKGANNINLVTPTHVYPMVAKTIFIARQKGLKIPVLSNCGGYEQKEVLELMEPFIDIYMPDMKYSSNEMAKKYSKIDNYVEANRNAIKEMYRQKGTLKFDNNGIAKKGILIRHLVLPNNISGSKKTFEFVANEISIDTYMSVMAQYHTANISHTIEQLNRKVSQEEYDKVVEDFKKVGLYNGWLQEL